MLFSFSNTFFPMKSLKIPKNLSKAAVNRKTTYNTMPNRQMTSNAMIYKTVHRKLKIKYTNNTKNREWTPVHWNGKRFCSIIGTIRVTLVIVFRYSTTGNSPNSSSHVPYI